MKKVIVLCIGALSAFVAVSAQDTVLNRNVTVEREFQPVIQAAGKVNNKPEVREVVFDPVDVNYSNFSSDIAPDYNMSSLLSQPIRVSEGKLPNGELTVGVGHTSTLLDFAYHVRDKRNHLKIYAEHEACWGRKVLEHTKLGLQYDHTFSNCIAYFDVLGGNQFYSRYGHYYAGYGSLSKERLHEMEALYDRQHVWEGGGSVGVRAKANEDIRYDVSLGYYAFHMNNWATEHEIQTKAKVEWTTGDHTVGGKFDLLDLVYSLQATLPEGKENLPRHSLRMEPYYEYRSQRVMLHVGVNLDLAINKGSMLSGSQYIAFAPSPNVRLEAQLAPKWLTLYAEAKGSFSRGSMKDYVAYNRYMTMMPILYSQHVGRYLPIDSKLGFYIRPHKNLLLDIYAGYALKKNEKATYTVLDDNDAVKDGMLEYFYTTLNTITVGGKLTYHYRDIFEMQVWGEYYTGPQYYDMDWFETRYAAHPEYARPITDGTRFYDQGPFTLGARFDGHIDKNWSVYTTLFARGSRTVLTSKGDRTLKPIVDWNLGAKYDWPELKLTFFAQLNNVICRYNDLYYGYQSEGTNFLLGATWRF